ncbi:MAG: phosphotransferase [Longimonas sp.]|uniref:phosphotransferase n=1 Tax=Longimonas sp. TaxID=2039626 RepID=UPI003974CF16
MIASLVSENTVTERVEAAYPTFTATGAPMRMPGGNLNKVWRVPGQPASVIAKYAPPHIASAPEVPLDPERLHVSARCLALFAPGAPLAELATPACRPPKRLGWDAEAPLLVMEDLGDLSDLGTWLHGAPPTSKAADAGAGLARFIGHLHTRTYGDATLAEQIANPAMQATRHDVQYSRVGAFLEAADIEDAEALGRRATALGERFQEPGRCMIMGDLWPRSVLVDTGSEDAMEVRLIDWELAHYGHPAQDLGHIAAHCWMLAHRAPSHIAEHGAQACFRQFLARYRETVRAERPEAVEAFCGPEVCRTAALHMGCEILARTTGAFQDGYLYDGLAPTHPVMQRAVAEAARHLRTPEEVDTFALLAR